MRDAADTFGKYFRDRRAPTARGESRRESFSEAFISIHGSRRVDDGAITTFDRAAGIFAPSAFPARRIAAQSCLRITLAAIARLVRMHLRAFRANLSAASRPDRLSLGGLCGSANQPWKHFQATPVGHGGEMWRSILLVIVRFIFTHFHSLFVSLFPQTALGERMNAVTVKATE